MTLSETFSDKGFVGPIPLLSEKEASDVLERLNEWIRTQPGEKLSGDRRFKPHLFLPFINDIVHNPILVAAVQEALQSKDILLWSSDFNIKQAQTKAYFPPHQDATYAGLEPANQCLTAWVALSHPVGKHEGCLSFWSGSHKSGQLPHIEDTSDSHNLLSRGQRVNDVTSPKSGVTANSPHDIPLCAGEATLHHFYTVHQSGPNLSNKPRVGLALRYMVASVRQTGKTRETVTLVSGRTHHDGFDLEPHLPADPSSADLQRGAEAHTEAMRREATNYFQGAQTGASGYDSNFVTNLSL